MIDKKKVQQIINDNRRVLVGLAHSDKGVKQPGCDCCYCKPRYEAKYVSPCLLQVGLALAELESAARAEGWEAGVDLAELRVGELADVISLGGSRTPFEALMLAKDAIRALKKEVPHA